MAAPSSSSAPASGKHDTTGWEAKDIEHHDACLAHHVLDQFWSPQEEFDCKKGKAARKALITAESERDETLGAMAAHLKAWETEQLKPAPSRAVTLSSSMDTPATRAKLSVSITIVVIAAAVA